MPNNSNPKMNKKNAGLTRQASSLMALEPRFMFDGAAVDTAIDAVKPMADLLHFDVADTALPQAVLTARTDAQMLINAYLAQPDARTNLFAFFNSGQVTPSVEWNAAVDQLIANLQNGGDAVRVVLVSSADLQGAKGAFTAKGPDGQPTIYLNSEWIDGNTKTGIGPADESSIKAVLIEEIGHSFDVALNVSHDSPGDEGELFSAKVLGWTLDQTTYQRISTENDRTTLDMNNVPVLVERAASNFIDVNYAAFDFNGSTTDGGDTKIVTGNGSRVGESWLYTSVITVGSSVVDAIVTMTSLTSGSTLDKFDSESAPYSSAKLSATPPNFLQPNFTWNNSGGSAVFTVKFIEHGSYNAVTNTSGTAVTLRNVYVNSYDLDSTSSSAPGGDQYTAFNNVGGLELSTSTKLQANVSGSTTTVASITTPGNISSDPGTSTGDDYRVRVSFDEVSTLTFTVGAYNGAGLAYYAIDIGPGPTFNNLANYDLILGGGAVATSEAGTADNFTIKLGAQPTSDVTITFSGLDATEGSLSTTTLTFTSANWNTTQTVTVTGLSDVVTDGDVTYTLIGTAASTDARYNGRSVLIDVTNTDIVANTAPVANNDTGSVNENATLTVSDANGVITSTGVVSGVDTDADGNTLTVIGVTTGSVASVAAVGTSNVASSLAGTYGHLTLAANGGYSYLADASAANALAGGAAVTDVFTYAISDGSGGTSFSTLTITVNGLNDASVMTADTNTVSEDTPATGNVLTNDSDVDNSLTVTSFQVTGDATVYTAGQTATITDKGTMRVASDGSYTFTPVSNWNGAVPRVTYTVNTGSTSTLDITVTPVANTPSVLSINDATVEEGSKAVFTVSLSNASEEALEISFSTSVTDPLTAEAGDIDPTNLVVTYNDGTNDVVLTASGGKYTIPAGVTTLTVKVPTVGDAVYEGSETFTLSANVTQSYVTDADIGTGTIKDDGTATDGDDANETVDNDTPVLSINDATVEEGSKAVFTVSLSNASEEALEISFSTSVTDPLTAEAGDIDPANLVVTYNDGTNDVVLTASGGKYTIPAGVTTLTVKVPTVGDAVYEGSETFTLSANVTQAYVTDADIGTGTIKDDGTATDGDDEGSSQDNDTPVLSINDATAEEGSKAVFTVSLSNAAEEALEISFSTSVTDPLTAEAGDIDPANLVVTYNDGTNDVVLTASGGKYTIPAGVMTLTVKVPTVNDAVYEGSETFTLSANVTQAYVTDADIGTGTIKDDGTATDGDDANETVDNDTPVLSINDATVEEGSKAVFTVSLSNAAEEALEISFATSVTDPLTAEAGDIDPTNLVVTYNDGTNDVVLTASGGKYTIPVGVMTLTVKVPTVNDAVYEGSETFTLSANVTQAYVTDADIGTGTIKDDGTATDGDDEGAGLDDDRPVLSVAGVDDVSEGSYAVFTVSLDKALEASTVIDLGLAHGTTEVGDYNTAYVVYTDPADVAGSTLTVTSNSVTVAAGVTRLYVAVQSTADAVYEGAENFSLTATFASAAIKYADRTGTVSTLRTGASGSDTSTIVDDGSGRVYSQAGAASGTADDDRPVLSVAGVDDVSEGSYAVFTVSLDKALEASTVIDLGLAHGTTEVGDYNTAYVVYTDPADVAGSTLTVTSNSVTVAAGVTRLYVAVQSTADAVYEGAENFSLTATFASAAIKYADRTGTVSTLRTGASGSDTSTIVDDGSGRVYSQAGAASGTADDDRPVLSVAGVDDVSEGSYAVFTVSLDKALESTIGIKLSLADNSALISSDLNGTVMEVVTSLRTAVGSGTLVSNDGTFSLPAGTTTFYVRVLTKADQPAVYEGAEKFSLRASFTSAQLLYADRTGVSATLRANASSADTSTILDDGTGKVYKPDGTEDLYAIKDDDRPKPESLPLAVVPAAPSGRLAEPLAPVPAAPQVFSSTLNPVAPRLVPIDPPLPLGDVLTSQAGYRIPVNDSAATGLSLNRGVTDQFVQGTQAATKISLPFDAFIHSDKDAVIKLEAKQADNRSLPKWVQFDPVSGVFEVTPPKGFKGKLDLKVIARDDDGREATALFQMFIGEQEKLSPQSRESFSEKLRMVGKRPITIIRLTDAQTKVTVRESVSHKVRVG